MSYWQGHRIRDFGHSMLCTRFNKRRSKIHQKTPLKSTLQLASILEPTWPYFGRVLGAKMGPGWHQISLNIDLHIHQKNITFQIALGTDFGRFWAPTCPPIGVKTFIYGPLVRSWSHLGVKTAPRPRQDPPGPPKDRFSIDVRSIFDRYIFF